jgi:hypothetical protein
VRSDRSAGRLECSNWSDMIIVRYRLLGALSLQRKALRMLNNLLGKVYIKVRPIEVCRCRFLHVQDLTDRGLLEPGKVVVRHEQLLPSG